MSKFKTSSIILSCSSSKKSKDGCPFTSNNNHFPPFFNTSIPQILMSKNLTVFLIILSNFLSMSKGSNLFAYTPVAFHPALFFFNAV